MKDLELKQTCDKFKKREKEKKEREEVLKTFETKRKNHFSDLIQEEIMKNIYNS